MAHHCHANGCEVATPPRLFMCAKHWKMVPLSMQAAVWKAYRNAPTRAARLQSYEYMTACADAVEHVAKKEGKNTWNGYRSLAAIILKRKET